MTDVSNAHRTMLMSLETVAWDDRICNFFGVPQAILPEIKSSAEVYGHFAEGSLKGVPICGVSRRSVDMSPPNHQWECLSLSLSCLSLHRYPLPHTQHEV